MSGLNRREVDIAKREVALVERDAELAKREACETRSYVCCNDGEGERKR